MFNDIGYIFALSLAHFVNLILDLLTWTSGNFVFQKTDINCSSWPNCLFKDRYFIYCPSSTAELAWIYSFHILFFCSLSFLFIEWPTERFLLFLCNNFTTWVLFYFQSGDSLRTFFEGIKFPNQICLEGFKLTKRFLDRLNS